MFGLDYYSQQNLHDIKELLQEQLTIERRKQVQRDREFCARYEERDKDPNYFDPVKHDKYSTIKSKYDLEKFHLLNSFRLDRVSFSDYPDPVYPEDFLTWQDYNEVDTARSNFVRALVAFERKKNRRARFWRVLGFLAWCAFLTYACFSGAK